MLKRAVISAEFAPRSYFLSLKRRITSCFWVEQFDVRRFACTDWSAKHVHGLLFQGLFCLPHFLSFFECLTHELCAAIEVLAQNVPTAGQAIEKIIAQKLLNIETFDISFLFISIYQQTSLPRGFLRQTFAIRAYISFGVLPLASVGTK